jgi:hypothetical protein
MSVHEKLRPRLEAGGEEPEPDDVVPVDVGDQQRRQVRAAAIPKASPRRRITVPASMITVSPLSNRASRQVVLPP